MAEISEPPTELAPSPPEAPSASPFRRLGTRLLGERGYEAFRYCLVVYIAVRVALFVVGVLSVALLPANSPAQVPGWPAPPVTHHWSVMFTAWERWDALWYLRIADGGYRPDDGSAAFFPGYPLLTRDVGWLTGGHPLLGAYVVANAALIVALVLVYQLTEFEFDRALARRTVVLLCAFPTSFFLFAPYSESLFLAFAAGALLAARKSSWIAATVLAACATATRNIGVVLAVAVTAESLRQALSTRTSTRTSRRTFKRGLARTAMVGGGSLLGIAGYLAWWWATDGSPRVPFAAEGGWQREFRWPWTTLWDGVHEGLRWIGVYSGGYQLVDLILVAVMLSAAVWVVLRTPAMYRVYTGLSFVAPLCLVFGGRPFMSVPRFVLVDVPLFWALALFARRFRAWDAVFGVSAAGMGLLSLLFVNWYWVF